MKPGDTLDGRYEITARLGAGGMGEVYKATHTHLGVSRVIKVIHTHISTNADAKERFLREARAATKVQHPNVATVHDFASLPDGAHYMVWEYIDGENLAQRLRNRGTMPPRQAVRIAIQALRGLEAIHRAGIVHRDISPENLMITADDQVKIIDLGVAKVDDPGMVSQTRTGIFVGKLRYASPEQLGFIPEGEKIDGRADTYAMAMVVVELLTGRPPYEATSPHEYFLLHAREPKAQTVELPQELPGSAALQELLEKALSRDRNQRFASAREFADALEQVERTLPEPRDMPTVATPLDGDETMKVRTSQVDTMNRPDTLHRPTVRTNAPAEPTVRTPLPAAGSATVRTPLPAPPPAKLRKGLNPAVLVGVVAILILAIGAIALWPRQAREASVTPQETTTTTATLAAVTATTAAPPVPQPVISEGSVTVTSPAELAAPPPVTTTTAAPPVTTGTVATATVAPVRIEPAPRPIPVKKTRRQEPEATDDETDAPEPQEREAFSTVATYIDGGGDSATNDRALAALRRAVRGTNKVALRGGGMQVQLVRALREHFPNMEFEAHADVVIRFDGSMERLGAGRKRRAATAVVEKNGRPVFRYELPDEVYRVGMSPPQAFARVLADAFGE